MSNSSNKLNFAIEINLEDELTKEQIEEIRDEIFWKLNKAAHEVNSNARVTVKKL